MRLHSVHPTDAHTRALQNCSRFSSHLRLVELNGAEMLHRLFFVAHR